MKIVQVIHGFPPENMAGSEVYTYQLSKELSKQHKVVVFSRAFDPARAEYELFRSDFDGIAVWKINNTFRNALSFEYSYKNDAIATVFGRFLDEVQPDIVHFGHVTCLSTTCIAEAKRRGIPIVYTLHDYWLLCPRGQFVRRDLTVCARHDDIDCTQCMAYQLEISGGHESVNNFSGRIKPAFLLPSAVDRALLPLRKIIARQFFSGQEPAVKQIRERTDHIRAMLSLVDHFIAPSMFLQRKYVEFGIPEERISHADYGFETSYYEAIQRPAASKVRFAYIGTLIPTKGVHVLIEAFNRVADGDAELSIWGSALDFDGVPDYGEYLKSHARNPQITFRGRYDNREIAKVLSQVDVLVVPSVWYENSPLTIHEAFLAQIPVIASDAGGMAELVKDGVNGLLFRLGDEKDLFRAMQELIRGQARISQLSGNRMVVKSIAADAREIVQKYEKIISGTG